MINELKCKVGDLICARSAWNNYDVNGFLWANYESPGKEFYSIVLELGHLELFGCHLIRIYKVQPIGIPFKYPLEVSSRAITRRY